MANSLQTSSLQTQRDENRLAALRSAVNAGQADQAAGISRLRPDTLGQAQSLAASLESALHATEQAVAERSRRVAALNAQFAELRCQVRSLYRILRLAVTQKQMAPVALVHYGIDYNRLSRRGSLDQPRRRTEWMALAQKLVEGSRSAQAVGHPPARQRKALASALAATTAAAESLKAAHEAVNQARTGLASLRIKADRCLAAIDGELHQTLRGTAGPQQLRVLCEYGVPLRRFGRPPAPAGQMTPATAGGNSWPRGVGSQM